MRVAICLSGLVRTYRETYDNYKQCLLESNPDCEFDVFISTWSIEYSNISTERKRRIAWYGPDHPPFPENPIDYNDIYDEYRPKVFKIIDPIQFDINPDFQLNNPANLQALMSMTYQVYSCKNVMFEYCLAFDRKYDCVIRHRFDTLLPFPIKISECDLSKVTVPSMMQPCVVDGAEWTNDKFAIGNLLNMRAYSDWYYDMKHNIISGAVIRPEIMLKAFLDSVHIETVTLGQEFTVVRPAGY